MSRNEQIKEDKIEKLIESFQIWVNTISPKGGNSEEKENLFNAKLTETSICFKKLKQFKREPII